MRAVLDTNIVVSGLIWGGKPLALLQAATDGDLLLYTSAALLDELQDVLGRPHFARRLEGKFASVEQALSLYAGLVNRILPKTVKRVVPTDADDDQVIAAAVAAQADLIVTGDRDLLRLGVHLTIRIVKAAEALDIIAAG